MENITNLINKLYSLDEDERRGAAKTLFNYSDYTQIPLEKINEMLRNKDYYIRSIGAEILGKLGDKKNVPQLIGLLKDEYWGVRRVAAYSLGLLKDERAIHPLINLLIDKDIAVHEEVKKSLYKIGPPAIPALRELLKNNHWRLKKAAQVILNSIENQ